MSRLPLEKSSRPVTSWPCLSSSSATCPPMKPAAPVTQTFAILPSDPEGKGYGGGGGKVRPQPVLPAGVARLWQSQALESSFPWQKLLSC